MIVPSPAPRLLRRLRAALVGCLLLGTAPAAAQVTFVARTDRNEMALGETLILEITLSIGDGRGEGYMPPEFAGFRILGEYPSQSTQIQMSAGTSVTRQIYSWRYELSPTRSGRLVIGPAKVRAGDRDLRTSPIPITVHSGALSPGGRAAPAPEPRQRQRQRQRQFPQLGSPFDDLFGGVPDPDPGPSAPVEIGGAGGPGRNFIRVRPSKTRVYVGEQLTAEWLLYLSESVHRFNPTRESSTDGFWSESLDDPDTARGQLRQRRESYQGRDYIVATIKTKALFPLQEGRLSISPMEAEISMVDFFGRVAHTQKVTSEPQVIEVLPLPAAGRPAKFDPAAVGRFSVEARVDRNEVAVGEPVSVLVTINGQGNLRKLAPPQAPALEGWKLYEPKVDTKLEIQDGVLGGKKTVEYLMLPERPGTTMVPAFELTYFDPAARRYVVEKTVPLRLVAKGEPLAAGTRAAPGKGGEARAGGPAGVENVIGAELRPPRSRAQLGRDLGTTFYKSPYFTWAVALPPLAFLLTGAFGAIRARMGRDTEGARRRQTRARVRRHLRAAEKAQDAGSAGAFYGEIDRVLRELLSARLGRPIAGHSRDELPSLITESGLPRPVADRIVAILDECDRARFAPGAASEADRRATLESAEELIPLIEKPGRRPTREERAS